MTEKIDDWEWEEIILDRVVKMSILKGVRGEILIKEEACRVAFVK